MSEREHGHTTPPPEVLRAIAPLRARIAAWKVAGESIAFVPTMGALHEGHLTLVRAARSRCRRTVVSIFVNPKQFGPSEDLGRYPRQEQEDLRALARVGADAAFLPGVEDIYPAGFETEVRVKNTARGLCGDHRPGHFDGVATVVTKLLNLVSADCALFGEKDYQQLQLVRRLALDLAIPTEIVGVPTVRAPDGLALSSRNAFLSPTERAIAPGLYRELAETALAIERGMPPAEAVPRGRWRLEAAGFGRVEYLELRSTDLAHEPDSHQPLREPGRLLAAAYLGTTRLIDNVPVAPADPR